MLFSSGVLISLFVVLAFLVFTSGTDAVPVTDVGAELARRIMQNPYTHYDASYFEDMGGDEQLREQVIRAQKLLSSIDNVNIDLPTVWTPLSLIEASGY